MMKKFRNISTFLFIFFTATICGGLQTVKAAEFTTLFQDSTLRVDYIFGSNPAGLDSAGDRGVILLRGESMAPGWAGRRHSLASHPLAGDGRIVMTDALSGDTLYVDTFSSLFQEWITDAAPDAAPQAFEHTMLLPMPRRKAMLSLSLRDKQQRPVASMEHEVDPSDPLIRKLPAASESPYETRVLHSGGARNPIDVAIVAEGYTLQEMPRFFTDAERGVHEILRYEPFNEKRDNFRFVAVATPSEDSGVSIPHQGVWKSTAFGSHFGTFGIDRYLTTPRVAAVHDALAGIPHEYVIILVNSDKYGGSGIYNSYAVIAAHHENTLPALVHEFGHSFGGLADEYFNANQGACSYPLDREPWEMNVTTQVDFGSKWADMVDCGEAGLYEGGAYVSKGVWRGAEECRMRNNTYPDFCPVCRRALRRLIDTVTIAP